jgi:RNA polymerase sigma-70 factor (ECF subfamily)
VTFHGSGLEEIFRHEKGKVVASLARLVGGLEEAEDCFSEAVEAALRTWPVRGRPDNPAAWLTTVARRKALDILRRQKRRPRATFVDTEDGSSDVDRLSLIFTCCHPALPLEGRVALTLRTLGGLSTSQIAAAFLVPETTMAQRLVRARRKIREAGIPFRIPPPELLQDRLDGVLATLYLIFNESYWPSQAESLLHPDTCQEAIFLASMLADLMPLDAEPLGLVALMCLQHSRARARLNSQGEAVTLEEQDRSLWRKDLMASGISALDKAMRLGSRGPYQIQAAIAAVHCLAQDAAATDWRRIVALYDALLMMTPSPVIELNRAVAVGMAFLPQEGLRALDRLGESLRSYAPFHAAQADLLRRAGLPSRQAYEQALSLEPNEAARLFLVRRIREVESADR